MVVEVVVMAVEHVDEEQRPSGNCGDRRQVKNGTAEGTRSS